MRPILEYGAVCSDPYREGQISALNWVQKRAAKFGNNINLSCSDFGTAQIYSQNMRLFSRNIPVEVLGKRVGTDFQNHAVYLGMIIIGKSGIGNKNRC